MADNKKQHYVPKFYLKLFSINQLNSHIKIFIKSSNKIISKGDLKNQAYENYFYGKDADIEKSFSEIEGDVSGIVYQIIQSNSMPKISSEEYIKLWLFTFLQDSRTKFSADETNNMIDKMLKNAFKNDDKFKTKGLEFGFENSAILNIETLINVIGVTTDLNCKLIINKTNKPFITSDNPIIRYNQFLEKRKSPFGKCGLASKGLQVIYPLNPNLAIIYYDDKVYKIGYRKKNYVETNNEKDIESLNLLQFLNSDKVVYSNEKASNFYLENLKEKSLKFNSPRGTKINETPEKSNNDGTYSVIMNSQKNELEINLNLSFIKQTSSAKAYKMSGFASEIRNENIRKRKNY